MRRFEILSIRLENIDLDRKIIFIPEAKSGARDQPITKNLTDFFVITLKEQRVVRHTLKHTAINHLVQEGVDLPIAFKEYPVIKPSKWSRARVTRTENASSRPWIFWKNVIRTWVKEKRMANHFFGDNYTGITQTGKS